jgi:hypothetical protein
MKIINLTQHPATRNQKEDGVFDLPEVKFEYIRKLMTFDEYWDISGHNMRSIAEKLATIAEEFEADGVMIGGAPWFMRPLEETLFNHDLKVFYAFSKRISIVDQMDDGSVHKRLKFVYERLVEVYPTERTNCCF